MDEGNPMAKRSDNFRPRPRPSRVAGSPSQTAGALKIIQCLNARLFYGLGVGQDVHLALICTLIRNAGKNFKSTQAY